jgi:RND family efflux transporter MFP subunit
LTRSVEVGQTAMAGGEALFRLSKDGETELRGNVAEQDLPLLKVGQTVDVRLTGTSKVYEGHIRLLGAVIDPATRLGTVKVALGADPNLRPGAFARAEVTVSNAERAVLPQTAVLSDDKGNYVLVVSPQGRVERRTIHVSGMVPSGVTISDGLNPKDQIVTSAGAFLQEGETVKPVLIAASKS